MLVLSRRTNETIQIGDEIFITVLGVEGDKVKIGISAPREVTILRGEIVEALKSQEKIKPMIQTIQKTIKKNMQELKKRNLN